MGDGLCYCGEPGSPGHPPHEEGCVAIYAATFDPPTFGHAWMIREALRIFRWVKVAIAVNPDKKPMFSAQERIDMLTQISKIILEENPGPQRKIEVTTIGKKLLVRYENPGPQRKIEVTTIGKELLVRYAGDMRAKYLVRGIRNPADFTYEQQMRHVNRDIDPTVETVFLISPPELAQISSSTVKGLVGFPGWRDIVRKYVPEVVLSAIEKKVG